MTTLELRAADKVAQLTVAARNMRLGVKHAVESVHDVRAFRLIAEDEGAKLVALEVELDLYFTAQHNGWLTALANALKLVAAPAAPGRFGGESGREAARKWLADNRATIMDLRGQTNGGLESLLADILSHLT